MCPPISWGIMKLSGPRAEFRGVKDLWFWNYPCFIINGRRLLWQVGNCRPHPWPGCIRWVDTFTISRVNTKGQQVCAVMFCTRKSFNQTIFFSSDALRMSGGKEGRIYVSVRLIRTSTRRIKMSFILARGHLLWLGEMAFMIQWFISERLYKNFELSMTKSCDSCFFDLDQYILSWYKFIPNRTRQKVIFRPFDQQLS